VEDLNLSVGHVCKLVCRFHDLAANRLNFNSRQFDHVKDNRLKQWRDQEYTYDPWGNLIEKRTGHSRLQTFSYDCENRRMRAETTPKAA
jgi:YD repeat-containing protein